MQSVLHSVIGPKKEIHDLTGRVALITGGSAGIGFEVGRAFVLNGARVILTGRKEEHGEEAIVKIKKEAGEDAKVEWVGCDFGSLKEVQKVFTGVAKRESRLDLLILSAGINANQFELDTDGIDRHFGINWLANFYVTNLLFPLLRKTSKMPDTPAPRIVFESSEMHRFAPSGVKFQSVEELNDKDNIRPEQLYARTKLAMILGAKYGLVDRVIKPNNDNIWATSVHPGAVNTDMQDQWTEAYPGIVGKVLRSAMLSIGRDPEQGSYSALWAATSPKIEEKNWNGYYFKDPDQLGGETDQASDPELGAQLWDFSHKLVKEKVGEDALVSWDKTAD